MSESSTKFPAASTESIGAIITQTAHLASSDLTPIAISGLELLILQTIASRPSIHGAAIARAICKATNGRKKFPPGAIYPTMQRIKKKKLVSSEEVEIEGSCRPIIEYTLSALGKVSLEAKIYGLLRLMTGDF